MICIPCCMAADLSKPEYHLECIGGTHCMCQHMPNTPKDSASPSEE